MHAKDNISNEQRINFCHILIEIVARSEGLSAGKGTPDDHLIWLSRATAAQRADAFLLATKK